MTENNVIDIKTKKEKTPGQLFQYAEEGGGYIICSEEDFLNMEPDLKKNLKKTDHIPTEAEIKEYNGFNQFRSMLQNIVNTLEPMDAKRPQVFTKKGNPVKYRYSSHDIGNVMAMITQGSNQTVQALNKKIQDLEKELKELKEKHEIANE